MKWIQTCQNQHNYLNNDAAAAHHLAWFTLTVDLAQTNPLTKLLVVINLPEFKRSLQLHGKW